MLDFHEFTARGDDSAPPSMNMRSPSAGGRCAVAVSGSLFGKSLIKQFSLPILLCLNIILSGCSKHNTTTVPEAETVTRTVDMSQPPVRVLFTMEPSTVHLDKDVLLSITINAPSEIDVDTPIMDDRLTGFILSGAYKEGPIIADGKKTVTYHTRLTPTVSEEYRIAPMAIQYTDKSSSPERNAWFATKPITLKVQSPFDGDPGTKISGTIEPVWIYPPAKTIMLWLLLAILAIVILVLLSKLTRKAHEQIKLMRMSPKERAMKELSDLLAKDLVQKKMVKEFYIQLTMIVRRYIERQHKVRAPEQTTEEFLIAVGHNTRFTPDVINKLKEFMQAADLVKFAAHKPDPEDISNATNTASGYIKADAFSAEKDS